MENMYEVLKTIAILIPLIAIYLWLSYRKSKDKKILWYLKDITTYFQWIIGLSFIAYGLWILVVKAGMTMIWESILLISIIAIIATIFVIIVVTLTDIIFSILKWWKNRRT